MSTYLLVRLILERLHDKSIFNALNIHHIDVIDHHLSVPRELALLGDRLVGLAMILTGFQYTSCCLQIFSMLAGSDTEPATMDRTRRDL
jgi:hypothetical protein